jgi:hypothetical protein
MAGNKPIGYAATSVGCWLQKSLIASKAAVSMVSTRRYPTTSTSIEDDILSGIIELLLRDIPPHRIEEALYSETDLRIPTGDEENLPNVKHWCESAPHDPKRHWKEQPSATTMQTVRYIYPAESSQGKWIKIADSDNSKGWKSDGYLRYPTKDFYLPKLKIPTCYLFLESDKIKHPFC